jgi:hypothetical protein
VFTANTIMGAVDENTVRAIGAGILMGALASVMLLRRILTPEAQGDRRWILLVLVAVVIAAGAGIAVGSLLGSN